MLQMALLETGSQLVVDAAGAAPSAQLPQSLASQQLPMRTLDGEGPRGEDRRDTLMGEAGAEGAPGGQTMVSGA